MTVHFLRMLLEGVFALTVGVLLLEIGKRKTLVAGRFVGRRDRPLIFWLWLAFDVLAVWYAAHLVLEFGGSLWP
ncbi:MAG TPA: hypothetical protein VIC34_15970 [Croceibacterium sp.]|jgi:hypothetical protein